MKSPPKLAQKCNRRMFLKAAGISIALPMFGSLRSLAAAPSVQSPKRMVLISSALGMNPRSFFPTSFGRDFDPSPVLQPLGSVKQDLTVFSHMDHPAIFSKHGGMNSLFSGVNASKASAGENVSVDHSSVK